ncbi:hypothetical protein ACJRO7_000776 [Eucalyptus globulus]|uniref:Transcription repressor n=1 Tax=Eucalyptus globulus TaxID=34317 RepID=A0ABD3LSW8_EUCGL
MGNYKFRLSDMMPNAWFYKLRDMERARKDHHHKNTPSKPKKKQPPTTTTKQHHHHHHHHSLPRKSYHFTRDLHANQNFQDHSQPHSHFPHDPPRNIASKQDPKPVHCSIAHANSVPDVSTVTVQPKPLPTQEFRRDRLLVAESPPLDKTTSCSSSSSSTCSYGVNSISGGEPIILVDQHSFDKETKGPHSTQDSFFQRRLPTIVTKLKFKHRNSTTKQEERNISAKEQHKIGSRRRSFANYSHSPGVKLKTKSPRLLAKIKLESHARKSSPAVSLNPTRIGNSFAVVKSSSNPARDFRESMVEMIVENNIKASKDLEELLTCYLSLNSDEYHQVIVDVFKQIWFDLSDMSCSKELINY